MTLGLQTRHRRRGVGAIAIERPVGEHDRAELAGLIRAGVMTFLLSGDIRLATRATRSLIEGGGSPPIDIQAQSSQIRGA
jgi:hypothetical protein